MKNEPRWTRKKSSRVGTRYGGKAMTESKTTKSFSVGMSAVLGAVMAIAAAPSAQAEDITFAVIGPHEYELPVNFQPFNVFVQYGEFNGTSKQFDSSGHITNMPQQSLTEGLSKYVHFWTFAELPGIGFAYEVIVPEVSIGTSGGANISGFGDTLTGPAVWFKPSADSTIGFQSFFTAPIGTSQVTNHYFSNYSSIFYDYQAKAFDITGNTGAVFRTDQRGDGLVSIGEGTTFHTNLRVGLKTGTMIEPFAAIDFQTTSSSTVRATGITVPYSNSSDLALGGGLVFTLDPKINVTLRYSRSVAGINTPLTNAGYLKFVYLF